MLFISHNLGVIRKTCEHVGVLYAGELVEEGPTEEILQNPRHPYTVGLLRCIPRGGLRKDLGKLDTIRGFLPAIGEYLPGCVYVHRCGLAQEICRTDKPADAKVGPEHHSRCHFHEQAQQLPRDIEGPRQVPSVVDRTATPLLKVDDLTKTFKQDGHEIKALVGVSAVLWPGETLGLVGESGSGKTTFARTLLGIVEPTSGTVEIDGREMPPTLGSRSASDVAALQIVFQNPDSALNRRHTVRRMLKRTLAKLADMSGRAADKRSEELVEAVRLPERALSSRPTGLSGGQKQRVAIARAFAGEPRLVVCDEPTSALDVSVQAAILNLLVDLQGSHRTSYVFISHDLGVVRYLSDRIAVLYLGRLMELGPAGTVFEPPHHPYTEALLSAVPTIEGEQRVRIELEGEIPSAADPPTGCVFHTRCPRFLGDICVEQEPPLAEVESEHFMRCHIPIEELRRLQAEPPAEVLREAGIRLARTPAARNIPEVGCCAAESRRVYDRRVVPTCVGPLEGLDEQRRHIGDAQLRARLPHAVVEHHRAEGARDRKRLGAGRRRLADARLVDLRAALLHPHVRAARAAAERPLAAAGHLERPADRGDELARRLEHVVVPREVAGVVVGDRLVACRRLQLPAAPRDRRGARSGASPRSCRRSPGTRSRAC